MRSFSSGSFNFLIVVGFLLGIMVSPTFAESTEVSENDKYERTNQILKEKKFIIKVSNADIQNEHHASTLLIACVDFRLRDETHGFMDKELMLLNDYDEMTFPGASLAIVNEKFPHWGQSINEIIELLKGLHQIRRVILLDHRGCGAYDLILGKEHAATHEKETESHRKILHQARDLIKKNFPKLDVHTLLMGLDGVIERID